MTIDNESGGALNKLSVAEDGVATGGARDNPLPYPFDVPANISATGTMADEATVALVVHPHDLNMSRSASPHGDGLPPVTKLTALVQSGALTWSSATQADSQDVEEELIGDI